jgi:organic hydroperoxide reductase OsmC/OhrA
MLSQVAQFAPQFEVEIEDASVDLRATFDSARKYGLSEEDTSFSKVEVRLDIRSGSDPERVRALAAHAEKGCHAVRSLEVPVPVSLAVTLNREALKIS